MYLRFLGTCPVVVRLIGRAVVPSEVLKTPGTIGKQLEGARHPAGGTFVEATREEFDAWVKRREEVAPDLERGDAGAPASTTGPGSGEGE